jgi:serine O-acetyltransferase
MVRSILFPGYFGHRPFPAHNTRYYIGTTLDASLGLLTEQIQRAYCFFCEKSGKEGCAECKAKTEMIVSDFAHLLPKMQRTLMTDVLAAYEGDPAATCPAETVFCYPGIMAITNQRIAHELYIRQVPLIPRMITELAHSSTGIDIHPGAVIGGSFFIDHGTAVVIGETCTIGQRVRLYQGVTLGAKSFPLDQNGNPIKGIKRHPDVEDDVIIYAGATLLGAIRIGRGSSIGGNVWLTHSIPPNSKISQADSDR